VSCFPESPINVVLNLNLPTYYPLQNVGGWIYVDEQSSGTRGLIVVRTTNGFKIYDRNAPHLCPDNNTTLSVENNIKIVCPKDQAEWILITGEPTNVAKIPPKTYRYSFDAATGILSIFY
jgi:nitrite reductase/ring-hydroxylating ferredoxin subunit